MSFLSCPICSSADNEMILSLDCGNLDGSKLYPTVRLLTCNNCGHAFNDLTPEEILGLSNYYNYEYAPANLNSVVKDGDLPGSTGKFTHDRYNELYQNLLPYIDVTSSVLDVGCAVGGFLDFLKEKGFSSLYGVDMTEAYVEKARKKNYAVEIGNAENLPYAANTFDVLIIEQVLEHLVNPKFAFREAARVLINEGILCIGVPDSARYSELYYFDFYWVLMREHIQHYNIKSINRIAIDNGFELLGYQQNSHPMMGQKMIMPNLCAVFKFKGIGNVINDVHSFDTISNDFKKYVETESSRLAHKQSKMHELIKNQRPVYIWGVGREFLYLYESAGLKHCNIAGIIDMNPFKQRTSTVNKKYISPPEILKTAKKDSILIITAIAHESTITKYIEGTQFVGEVMTLA